jgi:histone H3/H4
MRNEKPCFVIPILGVLKTITLSNNLNRGTKYVLNKILLMTVKTILEETIKIFEIVSIPNIISTLKILFPNDLGVLLIQEGKESPALFTFHFIEKAVQKIIPKYSVVHQNAIEFICGVIEYLCYEMLDLSISRAIKDKKQTVTVTHLESAIFNDEQLCHFYKNRIQFISAKNYNFTHAKE